MERLKAVGEYDKNKGSRFLAGPKKSLPKKDPKDIILIGDCLKKWRGQGVHISGCRRENGTLSGASGTGKIRRSCLAGARDRASEEGRVETDHGIHSERPGRRSKG